MMFRPKGAIRSETPAHMTAYVWATIGVLMVALTTALVSAGPVAVTAAKAWQFVHVQINRGAETPYRYGDMRFAALDEAWYDINAAEYYFRTARERDAGLPYVHHQLARIAFLRGDFIGALVLINRELEVNPEPSPSSYYIRGLIEGFAGMYDLAAKDYERYLSSDPTNWAAINDYAWVLLKAGRSHEALDVTIRGLNYFPDNPWLLNSNAIALYEEGHVEAASEQIRLALEAALTLTEEDWLIAYPGNDPRVARDGLNALGDSIRMNTLTIRGALEQE